jgi:sec-independent protein translocase protein TatA
VAIVFGGFGVGELLLLFLLLLLLFGAKRIPEIARGLGKGIRNFKSDIKDPDQLADGADEPRTRLQGPRLRFGLKGEGIAQCR